MAGDDHSSRIQPGREFGLRHLMGLVVQSIADRGLVGVIHRHLTWTPRTNKADNSIYTIILIQIGEYRLVKRILKMTFSLQRDFVRGKGLICALVRLPHSLNMYYDGWHLHTALNLRLLLASSFSSISRDEFFSGLDNMAYFYNCMTAFVLRHQVLLLEVHELARALICHL